MLKIQKLTLGNFLTNNYIIIKENKALLIDATESKPIIEYIESNNLELVGLILTHAHVDHICGVNNICQKFNITPFLNKLDDIQIKISQEIYKDCGFLEKPKFEYQNIEEGELKIENFVIKVIHTPGHTQGSISILIDNNLFSGDTLFFQSIGRTDLIGGNFEQLINSIKNKLLCINDKTVVFPGHGPETTIKEEKIHNPFLI
jgi:glyoxylase-like metal-dependent hydrolase (beta-lactamase superfamily II)